MRKCLHGLGDGAGGFAASGAAGGAIDDAEARKLAKDTITVAEQADRRYSGFTCYAALSPHRASNIEDVSYQVRVRVRVRVTMATLTMGLLPG